MLTRATVPPRPSSSCIGLDAELESLQAAYQRGVAEGGHTVLIVGEAGVGKSALLREFRRRSRLAGLAVLEGWCRSDRRSYQPFLDIVRAASSYLSDIDLRQFDAPLSFKILQGLVGSTAEPHAEQPEHWHDRRLALYRSVGELLVGVAQIKPPVVVIHDLQLADEGSLSLLRYLVHTLSSSVELRWAETAQAFGGLFVLSERDPGPGESVIASHLTGIAHTTVELRGLGRQGVQDYLDAHDMVGQIQALSRGNPRRLEALLWRLDADADQLLLDRLAGVTPPARTLISALAVLGRPASLRLLGHLTGIGADALETAAALLLDAKIVHSRMWDGELQLAFDSLADQESVLSRLEPTRLRQLYRAVGEAMLARGEEVSAAEHLLRGESGDRAAEVVLRAGERLEIAFAYERAIDLYQRTLEIATGEQRRVLAERLCDLLTRVGRYNQAADLAERESSEVLSAEPSKRDEPLKWDNLGQVKAELEGALAHFEDTSKGGHGWATILADLAEVHYVEGRHSAAEEAVARVLAVEHPDAFVAQLKARMTLGKVYMEQSKLEEAAALFSHTLAESRKRGALHYESVSLINLGITHLRRGQTEAAERCYRESLITAERCKNHRSQGVSLQNLGVLAQWRRDYTTALQRFQGAIGVFLQLGEKSWLSWLALDLGSLCLELGNGERAAAMVKLASSLQEAQAESFTPLFALSLRGALAQHEGDFDTAEALYRTLLEESQRAGKENEVITAKLALAGLLLVQGRFDAVEAMAREVCDGSMPKLRAQALAYRGESLLARGRDLAGARQCLDDALALYEQVSDPRGCWTVTALLADLASRRGEPEAAATLSDHAAALEAQVCARVPAEFLEEYLTHPRRQELLARIGQLGSKPAPAEAEQVPLRSHAPRTPPVEVALGRSDAHDERYPMIVGEHPAMIRLFELLDRVAPADSAVLIRGASGVGKELVAQAIHANSPRRDQPYIKVNCGALVESLLLSELFGHERGAFTGATQRKQGRFELAGRGTLLLDEIGELSLNTQVCLLRVLQEREFERVGGTRSIRSRCRVLCATNRDLEAMVTQNSFREDLYHRVKAIEVVIPPLRERRSDILLLAEHILQRMASEGAQDVKSLSPALQQHLLGQPWSGNVRELENFLRSAWLFSEGEQIRLRDLHGLLPVDESADPVADTRPEPPTLRPDGPDGMDAYDYLKRAGLSLGEYKKQFELACVTRALGQTAGNITQAAALLGMNRSRLSQYVKKHDLRERYRRK